MNDHDRRTAVLQAEEAVLQLAEELARAKMSMSAADEATEQLRAAQDTMGRTSEVLEKAVLAVQDASEQAQETVMEAKAQLKSVQGQLARAAAEVQGAAQQLGSVEATIQQSTDQATEKMVHEVRVVAEGTQRYGEAIASLISRAGRVLWLALFFSLVSCAGTLVCLLLLVLGKAR